MTPKEFRRFIRDFRRLCDANGFELILDKERGKGSHVGFIVKCRATGETLRFTTGGHKEISPGVQRGVIRYVASREGQIVIAIIVRRILEHLFFD
jgi:hypothetical protein